MRTKSKKKENNYGLVALPFMVLHHDNCTCYPHLVYNKLDDVVSKSLMKNYAQLHIAIELSVSLVIRSDCAELNVFTIAQILILSHIYLYITGEFFVVWFRVQIIAL